ncbi:unnamed protein product, partial [Owenia fusiformis]
HKVNMASSLSEEEFIRIQTQLLELRTTNYNLSDENSKAKREIDRLLADVERLDRDLEKANRAVQKSKKAREFEMLINENDGLQRKLISQEEEFRLQNQTLMTELGTLVAANENLEKEVERLKQLENTGDATGQKDSEKEAQLQDQLRHSQAQNTALQKNLTALQEKHNIENRQLQETIGQLELRCERLSGQRQDPAGAELSPDRRGDGQDEEEGLDITDSVLPSNSHDVTQEDSKEETSIITEPKEDKEDITKQLNDLQLQLDIEREESKLLKEQLLTSQKTLEDKSKSTMEEIDKLQEKLKKKQESLVQLQDEKENMYKEYNKNISDLRESKDNEIQNMMAISAQLEADLSRGNDEVTKARTQADARIAQLEQTLDQVRAQMSASHAEKASELGQLEQQYSQQISQLSATISTIEKQRDDVKTQLQETQEKLNNTLQRLQEAQLDRDKQVEAFQESNKLAEKRKGLLDELAIKYQKDSEKYREQTRDVDKKHFDAVREMEDKLDIEQKRNESLSSELKTKGCQLESVQEKLETTESQLRSTEEAKGWLERSLEETKTELSEAREEHSIKLEEIRTKHQEELDTNTREHSKQIQELKENLEGKDVKCTELEDTITQLKQEIKDQIDDKKIHEKKGASMTKDLKRQIQSERKRADKLQERLQEALSVDSKSRQSVEELLHPSDSIERFHGDGSSLSSFSMSLSGTGRDTGEAINSPMSDPGAPSMSLVQENTDLLNRLTQMQQEKWELEERINHLEESSAGMADELLKKQALMQHYAMETRTDHIASPQTEKMSIKRVLDFVKDKGEESQRDLNRKLQRMLEETLTKNMHLEKNLEDMSQEVVRLSKMNVEVDVTEMAR